MPVVVGGGSTFAIVKTGPVRPVPLSHAIRALALLLGIWLWALPQVMNSKVIVDLFVEQGTCPIPLIEEEELKHAIPVHRTVPSASHLLPSVPGLFHGERAMLAFSVLHGDVPVPPPWCGHRAA